MKKYNIEKAIIKTKKILDALSVKYTMLSTLSIVLDGIDTDSMIKLKSRMCRIFHTTDIREYCKFNDFNGRIYLRFKYIAD